MHKQEKLKYNMEYNTQRTFFYVSFFCIDNNVQIRNTNKGDIVHTFSLNINLSKYMSKPRVAKKVGFELGTRMTMIRK